MKRLTIAFSVILIFISIILYKVAESFMMIQGQKGIGPRAFPQGVSIGLIILSVLLTLTEIRKDNSESISLINKKLVLSVIAILIFALMFKPVGFVISGIFIMFATMLLMLNEPIKKTWLTISVCSLVIPIVIYMVFAKFLKVPLPSGILEGIL